MLFLHQKNQSGFTLVELAIAITIVGLMIGGVLKGQEMLENARIKYTATQIQSFRTAMLTFQDKYSARPGDLRKARQRVPECTAANHCWDGDGDNIIGYAHQYIEDASANMGGVSSTATFPDSPYGRKPLMSAAEGNRTKRQAMEPNQVWKHLAMAEFITGIDKTAQIGHGYSAFGTTHPVSPLKAGVHVTYLAQAIGFIGGTYPRVTPGHYFLYRSRMMDNHTDDRTENAMMFMFLTGERTGGISPRRGMAIDRMVDDGDPRGGDIVMGGIVPDVCGLGTTGEENFDEQETEDLCFLFARFE